VRKDYLRKWVGLNEMRETGCEAVAETAVGLAGSCLRVDKKDVYARIYL